MGSDSLSTTRPNERVTIACLRCRRQKLRCDTEKPCLLCRRAGLECQLRRPMSPPRASLPAKRRWIECPPENTALSMAVATHPASPASTDFQKSALQLATRPTKRPDMRYSGRGISVLSEEATSVSQTSSFERCERHPCGASKSNVGFATNLYRRQSCSRTGHVPNVAKSRTKHVQKQTWTLQSMQMPPAAVMEALIHAYFDRFHWFILLFHRPSFLERARLIISRSSWARDELGMVLTTLMVAALGLQCVAHDTAWYGRDKLVRACLDPSTLVADILSEVNRHLIEVLDDCQIETMQVYTLLTIYHVYHGRPNLAFAYSGVAVRIAHSLSLHHNIPSSATVVSEVERRCWNHLMVAETFGSMIYGRPLPYDPDFTVTHPILDMDDMMIESPLRDHSILVQGGYNITWATFHRLKYNIYACLGETMCNFRRLRTQDPISTENFERLVKVVRSAKASLEEWRESLPSFFDYRRWQNGDPASQFQGVTTTSPEQRVLCLQAITLQIIYDSAVIFINRPLLEHRIQVSGGCETEVTSTALQEAVNAALRISRILILKFEHEMAISFLLVHYFTAGVILCIPPTCYPFSQIAQEAKSGVLNIIRASKSLMHRSLIAKHSQELLTNLLKVTLDREIDIASDISQTDDRVHTPIPAPEMTSNLSAIQPYRFPEGESETIREDVIPPFSNELHWYWPPNGDMSGCDIGDQLTGPMDAFVQAMFVGPDIQYEGISAF